MPTGEYQALEIPLLVDPLRVSTHAIDVPGSSGSFPAQGSTTTAAIRPPSLSDASRHSSFTANTSTPSPAAPVRSPRRAAVVTGVVAATAVILVGVFWLSGRGPTAEAPAAAPSEAPAVEPPIQAASKPSAVAIDLKVSVSPEGARLFLDDKPLASNPFTGKLPQDGEAHTLRAEAPGYAPRVRTITFEKDLEIEFALDKEKSDKPAVKYGGPAAPPDEMKPGQKVKRNLDPSNPYEKK
jgi:hypothetical protein